MLAIHDKIAQLHSTQTLASVIRWATQRGIETKLVKVEEFATLADAGFTALYISRCRDLDLLSTLQPGVKVILEHDIVGEEVRYQNDHVLEGRPFAMRRAFGGRTPYSPEIQVPYCHVPDIPENWEALVAERDAIILDLHRWLPLESQFSFLALMQDLGLRHAELERTFGKSLRFYMTGQLDIRPYHASVEIFQVLNPRLNSGGRAGAPTAPPPTMMWGEFLGDEFADRAIRTPMKASSKPPNPVDFIVSNLTPCIENREDFMTLFAKGLAFITDHGDFADQDVSACLAMGVPLLVAPRSPWRKAAPVGSTLVDAYRMIAPRFYDAVERAAATQPTLGDGVEAVLRRPTPVPIQLELFEQAYDAGWERLWDWVTDGRRDDALTASIDTAPQWKYGMT